VRQLAAAFAEPAQDKAPRSAGRTPKERSGIRYLTRLLSRSPCESNRSAAFLAVYAETQEKAESSEYPLVRGKNKALATNPEL